MKRIIEGLLILFIYISIYSININAKEIDSSTEEELSFYALEDILNTMVTTASRSERRIKDLPVSVYVITREEILKNNYTSLIEALRSLPEIRISSSGTGNDGSTFIMRGLLGNYYTKILLDDMPLAPSVISSMPIGEQINMMNVDRIEVIFGPAAAMYGADSVAGVINIKTRMPKKDEVRFETIFGTNRYWYNNVSGSYVLGEKYQKQTIFTIYGLYSQRDGSNIVDGYEDVYDLSVYDNHYPSAKGRNKVPLKVMDLPSKYWSFGSKIQYLDFIISYDQMYRADPSSTGMYTNSYFYDDENAKMGENIQRLCAQHQTKIKDFNFKTNISYLRYRLDNDSYYSYIFSTNNPQTFGYKNKSYKYQASDDILFEETVVWDLTKQIEIVSGLTYQYSGVFPSTNNLDYPFDENEYHPFSEDKPKPDPYYGDFGFNPYTFYNYGLFLQGSYNSDKYNLMLGARYDKNSKYGDSINPRIAALYNLTKDTSIRASYNSAFKAPSPYYAYSSLAGMLANGKVQYQMLPNPNLEPEKLDSYELSVKHLLAKDCSLELVGFHNRIKNLISSARYYLDPKLYPKAGMTSTRIYSNDGNSESRYNGINLILQWKNIIPSISFGADFFVTYIKGEEILPTGGGEINDLREVPELMGKLHLSAKPINKLYVGIDNILCGEWYGKDIDNVTEYNDPYNKISGYYLMNIAGNYEILKGLKANFKIENVFDKKYAGIQAFTGNIDLKYNPQSGRSFYGGFSYTW
ncbi:MAG: TonB-dependent receptor [Desulfobacterales bacterium]|nr:TonB-dependent receptor [Desulfobacterales bacterium]